ncbi:MAG: hypothetical protein WC107_06220 [Patescibacteria group bacterium]
MDYWQQPYSPTMQTPPLVRPPLPQFDNEFRWIVQVKNVGSQDWEIYSPCRIEYNNNTQHNTFVDQYPEFDEHVYFGVRPNASREELWATMNMMLGVTQEPIPRGATGKVLLKGPTPVLLWDIEKDQGGAQEYCSRFNVMMEEFQGRWRWRYTPGPGDAKVLHYMPIAPQADPHDYYFRDGVYNDSILLYVYFDPEDYVISYSQSVGMPRGSIVGGYPYLWYNTTTVSDFQWNAGDSAMCPWLYEWAAAPMYDVPGVQACFLRRVRPGKCYCVRMADHIDCRANYQYGAAVGRLWQDLAGWTGRGMHFLRGDPYRYADHPYYGFAEYTGGQADSVKGTWISNGGRDVTLLSNSYKCDGTVQSTVQWPTCQVSLAPNVCADMFYLPHQLYRGWNLKAWDKTNAIFWGKGQNGFVGEGPNFEPSPVFHDAPCGTIRAWTTNMVIPGGWRICDGTNGTPDLSGRFLMGTDDVFAPETTGGYAQHGPAENGHGQINVTPGAGTTVSGSANTDNRPPFYTVVYIIRTDD